MNLIVCDICHKKLSDKRSLRRHGKTNHKIYAPRNSFERHDCGYETHSLYEMRGHVTVQHGQTNPRYCLYCNKIVSRDLDSMEHMNNDHGLPTWNVDADTISENGPVGKAFGNSMREYEVKVGVREIDLLHAMQVKSEEIKNIVRISVQKSPQKIQFGAVIQLRKPIEDSEDLSEESHKTTIHVQSKMKRVDFGGIADENFHQMVEQMLLSLNSFASHGSGWTLDQIIKIEIYTAKSKPIAGSSYSALPHKLSQTSAFLNIRNREDENCVLYCFTAAYHLKYQLSRLQGGPGLNE